MIYMFFVGYIIGGIVGAFILACILLANKMCVVIKDKKEIKRLNNILDTLMQDMALLNATGIKEIKPKYVFDRIAMLRGDDNE